jgi:hypothetical protein
MHSMQNVWRQFFAVLGTFLDLLSRENDSKQISQQKKLSLSIPIDKARDDDDDADDDDEEED